jgi:CheY-like chemotaxis protein
VHAVQFYERDDGLARAAAAFLAEGLRDGAAALAFASAERRAALVEQLEAHAIDVEPLLTSGQLSLLDARATLDAFLVDGLPIERAFRDRVGGVLERARKAFPARPPRAYGEMVDLLWQDGRRDAALELEELWDRLGDTQPVAVLCGYSMARFSASEDASAFDEVCEHHTEVRPHAPFDDNREHALAAAELARLQQRSKALETEVMERQRVELALHKAKTELAQLHRRLNDALHAKDEMLSLLGHELRNPLAPILTALELLSLRGVQRPEHAVIDRQARHLKRMLEDLVEAGRLSGTRPQPELRPVGLTPSPYVAAADDERRAAPRRRVLVVDDNADTAALLAELLAAFGQQTEFAQRADQALEVAKTFQPEVALLDLGLPVVDGFELARRLKGQLGAVRLVAVSGYGDSVSRARTTEAGFDAHLIKPVQISEVLRVLARRG